MVRWLNLKYTYPNGLFNICIFNYIILYTIIAFNLLAISYIKELMVFMINSLLINEIFDQRKC